MIDTRLAGRTVLVTGGAAGIGAAVCRAFAAEGATVVIHYLANPPEPPDGVVWEHLLPTGAEDLAAELGGVAVAGDLTEPDAATRLFDAAGQVDVLVNNAAHCEHPDTIDTLTAASLDRHYRVNALAPALLTAELARRAFTARPARLAAVTPPPVAPAGGASTPPPARHGRHAWTPLAAVPSATAPLARHARRGPAQPPTEHARAGMPPPCVVNISTDSARAFAGQLGYGTSKAALEAFTRAAAIDLGPAGIRVNAVAPGPVQTGWMSDDLVDQVRPTIPLRRVGDPADIADAVVFLASYQARWITGQVIQVAGGHAL